MRDKNLLTGIVLNHVRAGLSVQTACKAAGLSRSTFYRWLRSDASLKQKLRQAEAVCESWHIQNITNHAEHDWRASAWFLERRYPQRYGRRVIHVEPKNRAFF